MVPRILLVGSGLTGAATASLIREELKEACELIIWDKGRAAGGRMSTFRCPGQSDSTVDLGAQYISTTPEYTKKHKRFYDTLLSAGVLRPLSARVSGMKDTGSTNYVAPAGMNSIVKHFLAQSVATLAYTHRLSCLTRDGGSLWRVCTDTGVETTVDSVVLTMPVPQLFDLSGDIKVIIDSDRDLQKQLRRVKYSARYALGLFFDHSDPPPDPGWDACYITDDDIIRFASFDNLKRGIGKTATSALIHTSVSFGKARVEKTPTEVEPMLLEHVRRKFPDWPNPTTIKCQKWRYSQVTTSYPGKPGHVLLSEKPLLVVAGDAFTHSNMDGCLESALSACTVVCSFLNTQRKL